MPKTSLQIGNLLQSIVPENKAMACNLLDLELEWNVESEVEGKVNKAIQGLFSTEAKQFANLTSLQLDGWDIRSHDVGQIVSWMK